MRGVREHGDDGEEAHAPRFFKVRADEVSLACARVHRATPTSLSRGLEKI
jgi:hypothetical protein